MADSEFFVCLFGFGHSLILAFLISLFPEEIPFSFNFSTESKENQFLEANEEVCEDIKIPATRVVFEEMNDAVDLDCLELDGMSFRFVRPGSVPPVCKTFIIIL